MEDISLIFLKETIDLLLDQQSETGPIDLMSIPEVAEIHGVHLVQGGGSKLISGGTEKGKAHALQTLSIFSYVHTSLYTAGNVLDLHEITIEDILGVEAEKDAVQAQMNGRSVTNTMQVGTI